MTQQPTTILYRILRKVLVDPSSWILVMANILSIVIAIYEHWEIRTVMWVYWGQSLAIGFFNFFHLITLKDFSISNLSIEDKASVPNEKIKIFTSIFFVFHYGFFHFIYMQFLLIDYGVRLIDFKYVLIACGIFVGNHLFSYIYNRIWKKTTTTKENLARAVFWPYARIIPMHLTIIFGRFAGGGSLILFLVLKTVADLVMHAVEHARFERIEPDCVGQQ
jgi:hypothetical protein